VLASLGAAIVVAAAFEIDLDAATFRRAVGRFGVLAGAMVVAFGASALIQGRMFLPEDRWSDSLEFFGAIVEDPEQYRLLLIGDPDWMPGEYHETAGVAYRVIRGGVPTLDQARLAPPGRADAALEAALAEVLAARTARPGEILAPFSIQWLIAIDSTILDEPLAAQVDVASRPFSATVLVYENLSAAPRIDDGSGGWSSSRIGGNGPTGSGPVRVADQADPGWEPGWEVDDWANLVDGASGTIGHRQDGRRRSLALASYAAGIVSLIGAVLDRRLR